MKTLLVILFIISIFTGDLFSATPYRLTATSFSHVDTSTLQFEVNLEDLGGGDPLNLVGIQLVIIFNSLTSTSSEVIEPLFLNTNSNVQGNELRIIGVGMEPILITSKTKLCDIILHGSFSGNPKWKNSNSPFTILAVINENDSILAISDSNRHVMDYKQTGIDKEIDVTGFQLSQNYPNPFNPYTRIDFDTKGRGGILSIYNSLGKVLEVINVDKKNHVLVNGSKFSTGVYFYRLETPGFISEVKRMLLIK